MAFTPLAEHEYDDYTSISVGTDDGQHVVVFNGPDDAETVIPFDQLTVGRRITFYRRRGYENKGCTKSGSIAGPPDRYDEVGEWLEDYAEDNSPPPYKR